MNKFKHITLEALKISTKADQLITTENQSQNMDLTLSSKEAQELHERFFIDIQSKISDDLMKNLLNHFKDEGTLFDKTDLRRI
jgi:hypothetical protein